MTKTPRHPGSRLMGVGYAHALRLFAKPTSWWDVAEACNAGRISAQAIVRAFLKHGLVHVHSWTRKPGKAQMWTALCVLGEGEDAPCPGIGRKSKASTPAELLSFCGLVKAMQEDSYHGAALAAHLGMSVRPVREIVRALHKRSPDAPNIVAIQDYIDRPTAGAGYPLYAYAPGEPDMPKPKAKTKRQLWQINNARQAARRREINLLHAMVRGVSLDGRKRSSTANSEREAA